MEERKKLMAYIAGLFDGDGSFTLCRRKPAKEGQSHLYYPLIQFCNKDKNSLEIIKNIFGGYISKRKEYLNKDGFKRSLSFTLKIDKATLCKPLLQSLVNFLILKKDRAQLLLDFIEKNPFIRGSNKLSEEILKDREADYIKMKFLNDQREVRFNISIRNSRVNSKNECFWAYLAGLVDTDGSFSIKKENRSKVKSPVYSPSILLSMIDSRSIQYIRDNCEYGSIFNVKSKSASQGFCYRFGIYTKNECIDFIKRCLPYLTIKKIQALILLEFCEKYQSCGGPIGVTNEQNIIREDCYQRLINANKYGVYKSSLMDLKPLPDDAEGNKAEGESHRERSKRGDHENGCGALDSMET